MLLAELPDLTFPMVVFGERQIPWNLRVLMHRGGAKCSAKDIGSLLVAGDLGEPLADRLLLVRRLHEEMTADLVAGSSKHTAKNQFNGLRELFAWAEANGFSLNLDGVDKTYLAWTEHLIARHRIHKELSSVTVHSKAAVVGGLLTRVLGQKFPLVRKSRVVKPKDSGRFHKAAGDKLRLVETVQFGSAVVGLCNQLVSDVLRGPLPVRVKVGSSEHELWAQLQKPEARQRRTPKRNHEAAKSQLKRQAWETDFSLSRRAPLLNLRLEAELLVFIAQTGMNLEQAFKLEMADFRYSSYLDGYQVRAYKARRAGSVSFEVFSEYRMHFDVYLQWRREWFGDEGLLFPFVRENVAPNTAPEFHRVRRLLKSAGLNFIGPRSLRKVRVNWLLRELGDPEKVAELAQHDLATLHRRYERPHPQVAMAEITRFHQRTDPNIAPPAPGRCVSATPKLIDGSPSGAPKPDCSTGAGCLFCENHRDIDSSDHVWSLTSYRHLKTIELASYRPPVRTKSAHVPDHPAKMAVDRLTEKLRFFESSSDVRRGWVQEAVARVNEGNHHPMWDGFIQLQESETEVK